MHRAPSESDESDTGALALRSRLFVPIHKILNQRVYFFGGTQSNELNARIARSRHEFLKLVLIADII